MTLWTALVIIAALMILGAVLKSRYNAGLGYATDENGRPVGNPQREAELQQEIEELRERVQVLERITIEGRESKQLSAEIERLREQE